MNALYAGQIDIRGLRGPRSSSVLEFLRHSDDTGRSPDSMEKKGLFVFASPTILYQYRT
jgi:hypothetical protein